jgi:hypothetical protein
MLEFVESVESTFDPAAKTMWFAFPPSATKGQTLYLVLVHPSADTPTPPTGWASLASSGDATSTLTTFVRQVQAQETSSVTVSLSAASGEWHGELILFSGGGLTATIEEARADAAFSSATTEPAPSVTCLQAVDLEIAIFTTQGTEVPALPAGFTSIDGYTSSLVAARATVLGYARANATGSISPGSATTVAAVSGHAFTLLLRDALPVQPLELVYLVPGNIGLIGVDNRPTT